MGIYIKEIRKPKVCREKPSWNMQDIGCQFCIDGGWGYECLITGRAIDEKGVLDEECPLIEVKTPHGRLIDVDETWPRALQQMENMPPELGITEREKNITHTVIGGLMLQVPTVIEAEVE